MTESGIRFNFSPCQSARVADKPNYNGFSSVDHIVETSEKFLFIEVKNGDNKNAKEKDRK